MEFLDTGFFMQYLQLHVWHITDHRLYHVCLKSVPLHFWK